MGQKQIRICDRCKTEFPDGNSHGFKDLRGVDGELKLYGPIWDNMKIQYLLQSIKGEYCKPCVAILIDAVSAFKLVWSVTTKAEVAAMLKKTAKKKGR